MWRVPGDIFWEGGGSVVVSLSVGLFSFPVAVAAVVDGVDDNDDGEVSHEHDTPTGTLQPPSNVRKRLRSA